MRRSPIPSIRAILATIGGDDQITVVPHLDARPVRANPKTFLGYSDNTNLLYWLWTHGIAGYLRRLDPGPPRRRAGCRRRPPRVPAGGAAHWRRARGHRSRASRRTSAWIGSTRAALVEYGDREPTEPWTWTGPGAVPSPVTPGVAASKSSQWILTAGRFPADSSVLDGGVLLLETSEEIIPARDSAGSCDPSASEGCWRRSTRCSSPARPLRASTSSRRRQSARPPRRAARRRDRHHRPIQPGCRRLRRRALRTHPPAVDPPLRRAGHLDGVQRRIWADYR